MKKIIFVVVMVVTCFAFTTGENKTSINELFGNRSNLEADSVRAASISVDTVYTEKSISTVSRFEHNGWKFVYTMKQKNRAHLSRRDFVYEEIVINDSVKLTPKEFDPPAGIFGTGVLKFPVLFYKTLNRDYLVTTGEYLQIMGRSSEALPVVVIDLTTSEIYRVDEFPQFIISEYGIPVYDINDDGIIELWKGKYVNEELDTAGNCVKTSYSLELTDLATGDTKPGYTFGFTRELCNGVVNGYIYDFDPGCIRDK